jgi:UrcA family protein
LREEQVPTANQEIAMKICTAIISASVLSLSALSAASAADVGATPKSVTVRFADLDLNKVDGAVTLYNRLQRAARSVCSPLRGPIALRDSRRYAECVDAAVSNAVATVDHPVVTEYFAGKAGARSRVPAQIASER